MSEEFPWRLFGYLQNRLAQTREHLTRLELKEALGVVEDGIAAYAEYEKERAGD